MKIICNIFYLLLFIRLLSSFSLNPNKINERPIIGVFAQPAEEFKDNYHSYIASSYVKFIESAGARVVPIPFDLSKSELKKLFLGLNGLIFPGGDASLWSNETERRNMSVMTRAGQYLIQLAIESNLKNNYFPIWGTCLGYELIIIAITNDPTILNTFNSTNHRLALNYSVKSKLFKDLNSNLKEYIHTNPVLFFSHRYGMTVESFLKNELLNNFFVITSTSKTDNGTLFVSSIEARYLPIYGVQFHPEKNPFEWRKEKNFTHTKESIEVSQFMGDFFIEEARKNFNSFESEEEAEKYLIYNYNTVKVNQSFMECYFFKNK